MFRLHGLQGLLKHLKDCSKSSSERRVHMDRGQTQAIYAPGYGLNACVTSKCICQILLPLALVHCGSLEAQGRRTFKGVHWIGLSSRGWPVPTMPVHTPESQGPQQLLLSLKPVPGAWKAKGAGLDSRSVHTSGRSEGRVGEQLFPLDSLHMSPLLDIAASEGSSLTLSESFLEVKGHRGRTSKSCQVDSSKQPCQLV